MLNFTGSDENGMYSWIRGTGLMSATNIMADELESNGFHTFSSKEITFNILCSMHPPKRSKLYCAIASDNLADFNGGCRTALTNG
jgi:3-oxoacyl-ACP reductase-like protein